MKRQRLIALAGGLFLTLLGFQAEAQKMSKADFIKTCDPECKVSPNRHKKNNTADPNPIDQCEMVKYYTDMMYDADENKRGAELILQDVCPKALTQTKAAPQ